MCNTFVSILKLYSSVVYYRFIMAYGQPRSSWIQFACIGIAGPRLQCMQNGSNLIYGQPRELEMTVLALFTFALIDDANF